jgi:AhpC/TSA family
MRQLWFPILLCAASSLLLDGCRRTELASPPGSAKSPQEPTYQQVQIQDGTVSRISPFSESTGAPLVLIFTRRDCPISNRYAPEVNKIVNQFGPQQVRFWLVYPEPSLTAESIRDHLREYDYPCPGLWDPNHELAKKAGASITPEVAVYDRSHRLVYRGRIDDRYVDFGKSRPQPTQRDLHDVLNSLLAESEVVFRSETAIGCRIADLTR